VREEEHPPHVSILVLLFIAVIWQGLHLWLLWTSARYLRVIRTLVLPIRRLLFPLVPFVSRIESLREQETTQYYAVPTSNHHNNNNNNTPTQRPVFRKSVRRHYKRMEHLYTRHKIQHKAVKAETSLILRDVIPILWEHEQRMTQLAWPMEDFLKRLLVVTVVPDGILDLYYMPVEESIPENDEPTTPPPQQQLQLVSLQFSVWQGSVWHWFMYFCRTDAAKTGIWWHGALLAIHRGHAAAAAAGVNPPNNNEEDSEDDTGKIHWINAQIHQCDSKVHAGYDSVSPHANQHMVHQLYPWGVSSRRIPPHLFHVRLWDHEND